MSRHTVSKGDLKAPVRSPSGHLYSIKYRSYLLTALTQYYGVSCRPTGAQGQTVDHLETYGRLLTGRKFLYAMSRPHFFNVGNTRAYLHSSANRPDSNDTLIIQVITGNSTSRTCRTTGVGAGSKGPGFMAAFSNNQRKVVLGQSLEVWELYTFARIRINTVGACAHVICGSIVIAINHRRPSTFRLAVLAIVLSREWGYSLM